MNNGDKRVQGTLTKQLNRLARAVIEPDGLIDSAIVRLKKNKGPFVLPDCQNCDDRCCVHKEAQLGILLSLRDIANLVDGGLQGYIVGRYTFKKRKGKVLPEINKMPRLEKYKGNCIFYDEHTGLCNEYGLRPTICRRFPYEVDYKKTKSRELPLAQFIPEAPCPTISGSVYEEEVRQIALDAVDEENVSIEDELLLPYHHKILREIGFSPYLPSPEECPS